MTDGVTPVRQRVIPAVHPGSPDPQTTQAVSIPAPLKSISSRLGTRSWSSAAATCSAVTTVWVPCWSATCGSVACPTAPGWSTVAPPVWTSPSRCAARSGGDHRRLLQGAGRRREPSTGCPARNSTTCRPCRVCTPTRSGGTMPSRSPGGRWGGLPERHHGVPDRGGQRRPGRRPLRAGREGDGRGDRAGGTRLLRPVAAPGRRRGPVEFTADGYLRLDAALAASRFPSDAVAAVVRDADLWLIPLRGPRSGVCCSNSAPRPATGPP